MSKENINMVGGLTLDAEKIQTLAAGATEQAFAAVDKFIKNELAGKS